ncbi:MAG: voltage-gated chloride channel family protein [Bacteroidota bacterium]
MSLLFKFSEKYPRSFYGCKWLVLSLIIGLGAGTLSAIFLSSLSWATTYRESHSYLIYALPFAGLLIGLVYHYFGREVEKGNNLILESIHSPKEVIPFKMAPLVLVATIVTHLFGGSAGREGTALQLAAAFSDQLTKPFRLSAKDRSTLLIAGLSAGFASIFGTPWAGAIFGLEVLLLGSIKMEHIFPAVAAAFIADFITRSWQVGHTHYTISEVPSVDFKGVFYAAMAGIAFGFAAILFVKATHLMTAIFKKNIIYAPLRPFIGGLIVVVLVIAFGLQKYTGLGIPVILEAFEQNAMPQDFILKLMLTAITLGAGFKGGEVTPLFFIGAVLGSALALVLPLPVGLLAGMGFVAVFAGAANTPVACFMMAIELFGFQSALYVAIACLFAYFFSGKHSIYTSQGMGKPRHFLFRQFRDKEKGL